MEHSQNISMLTVNGFSEKIGNEVSLYRGNKIVVGIPCFNESVTISRVISDLYHEFPYAYIYVFDNNSTDGTYEIAKNALLGKKGSIIKVKNQAKGNVVLRFFSDLDADLYVLIDGDLTYDSRSIKTMVDKVLDEHLDMLVGRRIEVQEDPQNKTYRKGHRIGNLLLTNSVSWIFDQKAEKRLSCLVKALCEIISRTFFGV